MKNEKTLIEEKKEKEEKEKSNTIKFNECNHLLKTLQSQYDIAPEVLKELQSE